jgi:Papain family cysteine protease
MGLFRRAGLMFALMVALVACPEPTKPPTVNAPKITAFTATPNALTKAGTVTLEWNVTDATSLSISPNVGAVTGSSKTVNVTVSTTFELTAQNQSGTDKKTVSVSVPTQNLEEFFTPDKTWTKPIPPEAQTITPQEFKQKVESGELLLLSDASVATQNSAIEAQYQVNLNTLKSVQNPSESIQALLNVPANPAKNPETTLPNGEKVTLLDQRSAAKSVIESINASQHPDNALNIYSSLYNASPSAIKTQVPTPLSLQGQPIQAIQTALNDLNTVLGMEANLDGTQLEKPGATTNAPIQPRAITAGNGYDNDLYRKDCRVPKGLFARFRFPLKYFVSPIKNQASRGLCWAFTAIGALESRERVQNNNVTDLSEQFLAYKVKAQWSPSDFTDGFSLETALDQANANLQTLPTETFWTYNPAWGRQDVANDYVSSYVNSCDWKIKNHPELKYNGTCSPSAHQGQAVCTSMPVGAINFLFCATTVENYTGAGVLPSASTMAWVTGMPFSLPVLRYLLSQGHTLMASFPVYRGFQTIDETGYLTDRSKTYSNPDAPGNHAVQVVGFISNDQLTAPTDPGNAPGGGYFIIKNSWGCLFGDGGYAYIDAKYVQDVFYSLSYLDFDARRSSTWTTEQTALVAPQIVPSAVPRQVNLRVSSNLGTLFRISHPQVEVKNVNLTVQLNGNTIYNGLAGTQALLPLELPYTPTSIGTQLLRVTARYGSQTTTQDISFEVINNPATGTLSFVNSPNYVYSSPANTATINLTIQDLNELNPSLLCSQVRWEVDSPDLIESDSNTTTVTGGCSQKIRFYQTEIREVRAFVTDSDGLTARLVRKTFVSDTPVNPYPIINSAGITPVERLRNGNCSQGFVLNDGVTMILDTLAYGINCSSLANTSHYIASTNVENPSGEPLRFEWEFYISNFLVRSLNTYSAQTSSNSSFPLVFEGFGAGGTFPCYLTLFVTPDSISSRSKFRTVWTGNCKVAAAAPK